MPKQREKLKYICKDCGAEFLSGSYHAIRCEKCRAAAKIKIKQEWYKENCKKKKLKIPRGMSPRKSIKQINRELERYNKEHGTLLSYGQYVAMIEKGEY